MSFGTISTFFYLMKIGEQVTISKNYKLPKEHLVRYMKVLSEIRNICAHDERLYSIVLSKESEIPDTIHHINLQISKVNTKYTYGKNDFFAILIALKDVLDNKDFGKIIDEIDCELKKLSSILKTIPIESIMDKMGLPNNWKQIKII